jgi:UDP-N-acetyl-D-glucosamine dehydrogenase
MELDRASSVFVAHCPERLSVGEDWRARRHQSILVGALDPLAAGLARAFLETFVERIIPVSAPEVSEVSKLLENAFSSVNIALIAEVGQMASELNISATEICRAASTKASGYFPFYPGPGVGGHCLPNDLELLRHSLKSHGQSTPLIDAARLTISRMPGHVVAQISKLLMEAGRSIEGSQVLLVGIGFKPGCADTSMSPAFSIVRQLRVKRATAVYFDSRVSSFVVDNEAVERISVERMHSMTFPGAIVLAGDPNLATRCLQKAAEVILDTGGAHILSGEPLDCVSL